MFGTVTIEAEVRQVQHFAVRDALSRRRWSKAPSSSITSGDEGANVQVGGHVFVENKASKDGVTINGVDSPPRRARSRVPLRRWSTVNQRPPQTKVSGGY